jgi:hypothetical protein
MKTTKMSCQSMKSQLGLSMLGWLVVAVIFGFCLLTASKLGPHYLDNRWVVEGLKTLADDPEFPRMSISDIQKKMRNYFKINNVRGKAVDSLAIKKKNNKTVVSINYEERIPFLYNIDVLLTFHSELDSTQPDKCCRPASN